MHICMVTPHLPPYQSANTILPQVLAKALQKDGHKVSFIVPSTALAEDSKTGEYLLTSIDMSRKKKGLINKIKIEALQLIFRNYSKIKRALINVDLVHLHSNGFLHQITAFIAERKGIPVILTHYGTEIWHYHKKRLPVLDPFIFINTISKYVTYYSKGLMEYSFRSGINPQNPVTIYPASDDSFRILPQGEREKIKNELGITSSNVLVNVKRLHPLGGHEFLLKAMPAVLKEHPDTHLYICGTGNLKSDLQKMSKKMKLDKNVTFLGLVDNEIIWKYYAAADLYVLSSVLEALPTVAVEALSCGTPVVITDTPGGKELEPLFPGDMQLVEMKNPEMLANAINRFLSKKHRTGKNTKQVIERLFRTESIYNQYLMLYKNSIEMRRSNR